MEPAFTANRHYDASGGASHVEQHTEYDGRQSRPFEQRHGRRWIRNDEAYPLPCDLQELQRQNLKTLLACSVFGRAVCAPLSLIPEEVLEVGCGSAYWTLSCHEMFSSMGHGQIAYTGLDIAPLAPDLQRHGLKWTFVQHDMRRSPWPFDGESFDLIMCKDLSLASPLGAVSQQILDECIRLLRVGGTLEIWESDHVVRSILPHSPVLGIGAWEQQVAQETATFPISSSTPFSPTRNRYLRQSNAWISRALGERGLPSTPCARVTPILLQEPDSLGDIGFRRIAIPLSELSWERRAYGNSRRDIGTSQLNAQQLAFRAATMLAVVQMIESLESILKEASGKNTEEWSYWWSSMMSNLSASDKSPLDGECMEIGAWWAFKLDVLDNSEDN